MAKPVTISVTIPAADAQRVLDATHHIGWRPTLIEEDHQVHPDDEEFIAKIRAAADNADEATAVALHAQADRIVRKVDVEVPNPVSQEEFLTQWFHDKIHELVEGHELQSVLDSHREQAAERRVKLK